MERTGMQIVRLRSGGAALFDELVLVLVLVLVLALERRRTPSACRPIGD